MHYRVTLNPTTGLNYITLQGNSTIYFPTGSHYTIVGFPVACTTTTVPTPCHYCKYLLRKKLFKDVSCSLIEFPVRLPGCFLGYGPRCVEAVDAEGSTTLYQGLLCINQVNSGRAVSVD